MADAASDETTEDETASNDTELDNSAYVERMEAYKERLAEQRHSAIEAGRRKGGMVGAAMAGAMMAVADIYEGKKDNDAPVVIESNSDPEDIDRDGILLNIDGRQVEAPPLDRR